MDKLFSEFYQVKNGLVNKTPGTGWGWLSPSVSWKCTAVRYGESPGEGKGTTFRFSLPLSSGKQRADGIMANKILVADDDPMVLTLVKDVLTAQGYEVITASDGKPGLEAARKERPDLILLDIMMPGMDGYASSQLKADPDGQNPGRHGERRRLRPEQEASAGDRSASDYITKPFDLKNLVDVSGSSAAVRAAEEPPRPES